MPATSLPLPAGDGRLDAIVTLDGTVVWRTSLAGLRAAAAGTGVLALDGSALRPRLATALRLALRLDGPGVLDGLRILAVAAGEDAHQLGIPGAELAATLDLVPDPATGRLLDGEARAAAAPATGTRVVAWFLPQFHPFAVNDAAWGDGFTEWSNVLGARPQFPGHAMPLLPADLGFYDLRLPDVRRRQGELAAANGIDAFCYHYYWFSGRRVMDEVLDDILYSGTPATPFCLCWANETWSRRWDGTEQEVLLHQDHDPATDCRLAADLLRFFADERYLTVDGAPVLVIYRLGIMNDPARVIAAWRDTARAAGFPGLFVVAARTFGLQPEDAPMVDALVDFPPHAVVADDISDTVDTPPGFTGAVYDYRQAVLNALAELPPAEPPLHLPGVMPRWDNTARRGAAAHLFHHATPAAFQLWVSLALVRAATLPEGRRLLFVNSWNEWGEGAMLEPDRAAGHAFLHALRDARGGYAVSPRAERDLRLATALPPGAADRLLAGFADTVGLAASLLGRLLDRRPAGLRWGRPEVMAFHPDLERGGRLVLDRSEPPATEDRIAVAAGSAIRLDGWAVMDPAAHHAANRTGYLVLLEPRSTVVQFHLPVVNWLQRLDVRDAAGSTVPDEAAFFGFSLDTAAWDLPEGEWEIGLLQPLAGRLLLAVANTRLARF